MELDRVGTPDEAEAAMPLSAKFAQVKRLLAAAEFQQAAVLCEELLVLQPGHAGACVSLGVVALQAGQRGAHSGVGESGNQGRAQECLGAQRLR